MMRVPKTPDASARPARRYQANSSASLLDTPESIRDNAGTDLYRR